MSRERGHDILSLQFLAHEVFGAVELDRAATVGFPDKRYEALGDGKSQVMAGIDIRIEREARGKMAECRPEPIAKDSGEPSPVFREAEASAGFLAMIIAKEALARHIDVLTVFYISMCLRKPPRSQERIWFKTPRISMESTPSRNSREGNALFSETRRIFVISATSPALITDSR